MKTLSSASTVVFLSLLAAATAAPSNELFIDQVEDKLLSPNRYSRMLLMSDECMAGNEALAADPIFAGAVESALQSCPEAISVTASSMTIDYSVCPSVVDDIKRACDAVNGK